jgi:pimeloyl-ACP methyl ester carboxylesterase
MTTKRHGEGVAQMSWNEFEQKLHHPTMRGKAGSTTGDTADLRAYFGEEEYEELRRLAVRSATRSETLGNVVVIPGIMGSHLTSTKGGDSDLIWVNFARLALGRIAGLRLDAQGEREADGRITIRPTEIDKRTYARLVLSLRARWQVETFAFDWRRDIDASADKLRSFIEEKFHNQPVHLVAHSMGGLVARSLIRRHPKLWERMWASDDGATETHRGGGRLVMLGTPNYGSFTIPQVLTGEEKLVRWLSKLDLSHSLSALLDITNTFVGSYQMLPAPDKLSPPAQALYRKEIWGAFSVSARHLERARKFHEEMNGADATIQPERMTYIAGCNRRTLTNLEIVSPGEFRYIETYDGDGRVPHTLGRLEGVPVYYVDEGHGSLPKNEQVITAIDELLERGRTAVLPHQPTVSRAAIADDKKRIWRRSLDEYQVGGELERIARRVERNETNRDEERAAEETIMRAVMGEERPARNLIEVRERALKSARPSRRALHIEVVHGDITKTPAPVVVVGHYKGLALSNKSAHTGGALEALDEALNGWIREAARFSMIGGELGQLFFIPAARTEKEPYESQGAGCASGRNGRRRTVYAR